MIFYVQHLTDISINCCSAEALDNHLTAVQRDHEHKSQIEERRIRDDAVREEAQRREKALHEEKVRQEKIKAEAEVCFSFYFQDYFAYFFLSLS
jgi:hypothetical protein